MYIICIVDFENNIISEELVTNTQFRNKVIEYTKKQLEELETIDNVIKELLSYKDFDFKKNLGIYLTRFLKNLESFNVDFGEISFLIEKDIINELIQGFRVFYVVECTIFVPILAAPKWVKGLIEEKDMEMQIFAPGFTLKDERFHLEILEFNSSRSDILNEIATGKLLILYTLFSQLI